MAPTTGTAVPPGQANAVHPARTQAGGEIARLNPGGETARLNQAVRRLCASLAEGRWVPALVDAASQFAPRAAVFSLREAEAILERDSRGATLALPVKLSQAPALLSAAAGADPVVALRDAREISAELVAAFGDGPALAYLYPLRDGRKAEGLLYAEGQPSEVDGAALELLASVVTLAWRSRDGSAGSAEHSDAVSSEEEREYQTPKPEYQAFAAASADSPAGGAFGGVLVRIEPARLAPAQAEPSRSPAEPAPQAEAGPPGHPNGDWEIHLRAERFARVRIAEMRLYKSQAVREGRRSGDLYAVLREDIDRGREVYRTQFMKSCPSMVDYFHEEMVRTLANHDASLLGERYPGPLV
jgi:hypothetical protein